MDNVTQKTIPYNVLNYDNYTVYHLHSDYSNANGYADSCSKFKEYIKLAKKQNMKALAFSEHGNCYDWIKKKQECDKAGIKYIHGVEMYLCTELQDDDRERLAPQHAAVLVHLYARAHARLARERRRSCRDGENKKAARVAYLRRAR